MSGSFISAANSIGFLSCSWRWQTPTARGAPCAVLEATSSAGNGTAVDHIRLADVAQRVGLTVPAAYRIWGGGRAKGEGAQDRFRKGLARYCIEHIGREVPDSVVSAGMALIDADTPLPGVIRICVKLDFDDYPVSHLTSAWWQGPGDPAWLRVKRLR